VRGDADPVTVAPDGTTLDFEVLEVRLAVARIARVVPEPDRHRRHRLGDDELADRVVDRVAVVVPGLQVDAEAGRLQLAEVHRDERAGTDERPRDVRATAGREQPDVVAELVVDPAETLGGQGRTGRADRAQTGQRTTVLGLDAGLQAAVEIGRAGAEHRDARVLAEVPQDIHRGVARVAVEQDDRRVGHETGDEVVPHHPAGGREPQDAVAGPRVVLQPPGLEMLEHDPAVPVDDRLGQAGRAGAVEHPQRVVEGNALERERLVGRREGVVPVPACGVEVAEPDDALHRRQRGLELGDHVVAPEALAPVAVAVDRQQHLGLDLGEAVDDGARPEVRGAARPGRTQARHGEEGGDRLGHVREVADDAIAAPDAHQRQARPDPRGLGTQAAPGPGVDPVADLARRLQREVVVGLAAEDVLGERQRDVREPLRARHRGVGQRGFRVAVVQHVEAVPHRRAPEAPDVLDRPGVQGRGVREPQVVAQARHLGLSQEVLRRRPQRGRFVAAHGSSSSSRNGRRRLSGRARRANPLPGERAWPLGYVAGRQEFR